MTTRAGIIARRRQLPAAGVLHARPWLARLEPAVLEQFDRDPVGRLHERHMSVARRAVDRDPAVHQPLAGLVTVVDPVREVPEVAPAGVMLAFAAYGRPVVGQLALGDIGLPRRSE